MKIDLWRTEYHSVNSFRQFSRDWQPRNAPYLPMLVLHGSLTQSGMWIALAETVGSIRMLCPDQRGFGLSEEPKGDSCAEFASDALVLARTLLPERYVIMGHSFACSIALEAACIASRHVAAVVLVDPVMHAGGSPGRSTPYPETFATFKEAGQHFQDTEEGKWTDGALQRFIQDIMLSNGESGPWRFPYTTSRLRRLRTFIASSASDYSLIAKAQAVRCPVLVFRGGMSKRFPPSAEQPFLEVFTSKPKIVVCPESGHFPTATEPDIIARELKHFLEGIR
jgi:pimeloyl-ACP methyl ester carboxylesterase